jgi:hypothetical protein
VNQSELNEALARSPSPDRITPEYLQSRIAMADFYRLGGTLTVCVLTLDNGFQVTGESACASPANYNQEIGEKIARDNAERKMWPLLGFALKEAMAAREILPKPVLGNGWHRCQSHKTVDAAVIRAAEFEADGSGKVAIRNAEGETDVIQVRPGFVSPGHVPAEGDVLVRYLPDGYVSWSPRDKFDAGYTDAKPPADYRDRVRQEREELAGRLAKLTAYLEKNPKGDPWLYDQMGHMSAYLFALDQRIAAF